MEKITDGINYMDIVENYLKQFQANMNVKDVIYKIVKDNLINKRALRNRCIVQDFDIAFKINSKSLTTIYDDLAFKYNLSCAYVREIIALR